MYRFEVTGEIKFHASHHLKRYRGTAETPHEHDYRLRVTLSVDRLDDDDISVDFILMDQILTKLKAKLDQSDINQLPMLVEKNPTAENFALYIGEEICDELRCVVNARLASVEIWELTNMSVRVIYD